MPRLPLSEILVVILVVIVGIAGITYTVSHPNSQKPPDWFARVPGDTFKVVSEVRQIPNTNIGVVSVERSSDGFHYHAIVSLPYNVALGTKVTLHHDDSYRWSDGVPIGTLVYLDSPVQ